MRFVLALVVVVVVLAAYFLPVKKAAPAAWIAFKAANVSH
jgi:hypothetical protein